MKLQFKTIDNYPKDGIKFVDLESAYRTQLTQICNDLQSNMFETDAIIAIGSRGWVTGSCIADRLGLPLFMARADGRGLPDWYQTENFSNEYAERKIQFSPDVTKVKRITIIDDLIATGNSIKALESTLKSLGVEVAQILSTIKLKEFDVEFESPLYYVEEV